MLTHTAYGKSRVRLVQVSRRGDRHALRDLAVDIRFEGEFDASYTAGDNSEVLPTDTMKNTVYAMAARHSMRDPESFGLMLGRHFLEHSPRLECVTVHLIEYAWRNIAIGERDHGTSFMRRGPDTRTATVASRREGTRVEAGIDDLLIMKTAHSSFAGFPRDEFTTLPETRDRLLATSMTARWQYQDADVEFEPSWRVVRDTLLETFALHHSESVQHTLYAMGQAVIDGVDVVTSITLTMPNKHHLPIDLSKFGLDNRNEIFVATEEPFGLIEATIAR
jgi:urate oxidase